MSAMERMQVIHPAVEHSRKENVFMIRAWNRPILSVPGSRYESKCAPVVKRTLKLDKIGINCCNESNVYMTAEFIDLNRDAMFHVILKMAVMR
ncbi:hypothetical protein AMS62_11115 [Bacillus sp. FJAT-18019]|nr:hypothetical protein AMS62_11115 [Bacillus sp. FJAT-18019]